MIIAVLIFLLFALCVFREIGKDHGCRGDCPCCDGRGDIGCKLCEGTGYVPWCINDTDDEDYGKCHFGTSSLGRECPNCFRKRK